jgi:hypothetical protein
MYDDKIEYVYCMTNKSFNNDLVKIGWTTNNPNKRAQQLYTTGVPKPFTIEFIIKTPDGRALESRIHSYLSHCRENNSREFFNISVTDLRKILNETMKLTLHNPEPEPEPDPLYNQYYCVQPKKGFERCSKQMMQYFNDLSGNIDMRPVFFEEDPPEDLSSRFEKFRYKS